MPFSVGAGGALDGGGVVVVVVVVVVVEVVEGDFSLLVPHPDSSPVTMSAAPPAATIKRRVDEFELMKPTISLKTAGDKLSHQVPMQPAASPQPTHRRLGDETQLVTASTASASSGRHTTRSGSSGSGRL